MRRNDDGGSDDDAAGGGGIDDDGNDDGGSIDVNEDDGVDDAVCSSSAFTMEFDREGGSGRRGTLSCTTSKLASSVTRTTPFSSNNAGSSDDDNDCSEETSLAYVSGGEVLRGVVIPSCCSIGDGMVPVVTMGLLSLSLLCLRLRWPGNKSRGGNLMGAERCIVFGDGL